MYTTMLLLVNSYTHCSGDGTLRKNPMIWKNWNPAMGPALHKLVYSMHLIQCCAIIDMFLLIKKPLMLLYLIAFYGVPNVSKGFVLLTYIDVGDIYYTWL